MTNTLLQASTNIEAFRSGSLRSTISGIEHQLSNIPKSEVSKVLQRVGIQNQLLLEALLIKKTSSQINEILHAIGILLSLPFLLEDGEIIESLSLAAGNTGKGCDLETDRRVAEFTLAESSLKCNTKELRCCHGNALQAFEFG